MPIQAATEADLSGILTIYNDAIAHSTAVYTEEAATLDSRRLWLADRRSRGYPVLVASDGAGGVAGFASFGDFRPWPGYRHTVEHSVYVRADCRGQGLGTALIEPLLTLAAALGKHVMVAGIDAANPASLRLHDKLGFTRVGRMHEVGCKFGRWLDLVFMQRILSDGPPA